MYHVKSHEMLTSGRVAGTQASCFNIRLGKEQKQSEIREKSRLLGIKQRRTRVLWVASAGKLAVHQHNLLRLVREARYENVE